MIPGLSSPLRQGSSPLARGLQDLQQHPRLLRRIIPARAGFTVVEASVVVPNTDHPRSRGVYLKQIARDVEKTGSSPLARGLPRGDRLARAARGIIPARAGFTADRQVPRVRMGDHPRSRGVYDVLDGGMVRVEGSSPLARGLLR